MSLSSNNYLVAAQSETVWGEDPWGGSDPTEFIAFESFQPTANYVTVEDQGVRATHSGRKHDIYGGNSTISYTTALTGIKDPEGTPSFPLAALFKAAGFKETVGVEPSHSFNLVTGNSMSINPSVAFAYYQLQQDRSAAQKRLFLGNRGNMTMNFAMGEQARITGDLTGTFTDFPAASVAMPSNPTSYTGDEARFLMVGATLSIGGSNYECESCEFSTGWEAVPEESGTAAVGTLCDVFLTRAPGSRPSGSLSLKGRTQTLYSILPEIYKGSVFSLEVVLTNANGDRLTVEAPSIQFEQYSEEVNGNINYGLPFVMNGTGAGENELLITFDRVP